ncbi:MAG TPA: hypothetical protein ENH15_02490 [Actinobacteria bacterium]|nr:hypothetical protein [Actinomycetota bacterium]
MSSRCNQAGDTIEFVRQIHRLDFVEAVQWLANRTGITITRPVINERSEAFIGLRCGAGLSVGRPAGLHRLRCPCRTSRSIDFWRGGGTTISGPAE